jgi:hypothetical protein
MGHRVAHPRQGSTVPLIDSTNNSRDSAHSQPPGRQRRITSLAPQGAPGPIATVENNISLWWNKPIVLDTIGRGNVIAYNYVDQAIIMGTRWQENALDGAHQTFSHFDLFEGNWAPNVGSDSTHGNAGWMTFFRDYTSGRNSFSYNIGERQPGRPNQNLRAAGVDAWNREHTFVGNVFNTVDVGQGLVYEATPRAHSAGSPVYRLGDNGGGAGGVWDDGTATSLVFRHGNWDNVTGTVVGIPLSRGAIFPTPST